MARDDVLQAVAYAVCHDTDEMSLAVARDVMAVISKQIEAIQPPAEVAPDEWWQGWIQHKRYTLALFRGEEK